MPLDQEYFTQIANRLQQPLPRALLDSFFTIILGLIPFQVWINCLGKVRRFGGHNQSSN